MWDIVKFAQSKNIPAQGRGSAVCSLVAYLLDITTVDPVRHNLVFARFLNEERSTIPDIDLDFASARDTRLPDRDDVLTYVGRKYGFEHVGLACMFITFGAKRAIREVGQGLWLSQAPFGDDVALHRRAKEPRAGISQS